MNGILVVNKQKNMTSRDVVNILCKKFNTKKVGHTGTLDPMAEGVLVIAFGNCLKIVDDITCLNKVYEAQITLGISTDTLDITGNVLKEENVKNISEKDIDEVLNSFIGEYNMEVPKYSAIKVNGKKLYEYARNNEEVIIPTKKVSINSIKRTSNLKYKEGKIMFDFTCDVSKGTYIRSLIRDIANKLNTIGTMSSLTRIKQGNFDIKNSYTLSEIENDKYEILNMEDVIDLPKVEIDEYLYNKIRNGSKLQNRYEYDKFCFVFNNKVVAIYIKDKKDETKVKPKRVFI